MSLSETRKKDAGHFICLQQLNMDRLAISHLKKAEYQPPTVAHESTCYSLRQQQMRTQVAHGQGKQGRRARGQVDFLRGDGCD